MSSPAAQALSAEILALARARGNARIACAESCTGGGIASALTDTPGMSAVFRGSLVAYSTEIKKSLLGVPESTIQTFGVVSCECAEAMASGAARLLDADFSVSVTGIAGPGECDGVPAGTVCLGIFCPLGVFSEKIVFPNASRERVKTLAIETALRKLRDALRKNA